MSEASPLDVPEFPNVGEAVVALFGADVFVRSRRPVGGGCIANGTRLELSNGGMIFEKSGVPREAFRAEAEGLAALRASGGVRAPQPLAIGPTGPGVATTGAFLLMEHIAPGRATASTLRTLGEQLARTHHATSASGYGFYHDNFIGSTPQPNPWTSSWVGFFGEHRIMYQVELAASRGRMERSLRVDIERLVGRLGELLPEPDQPALLHGDLWGGNWICGEGGTPWIIDPAAYFGHREADLAMTRLFGGFDPGFYDGYEHAWPLEPGFAERVPLYNLYHLLNHANIFGGGYLAQAAAIVRSF